MNSNLFQVNSSKNSSSSIDYFLIFCVCNQYLAVEVAIGDLGCFVGWLAVVSTFSGLSVESGVCTTSCPRDFWFWNPYHNVRIKFVIYKVIKYKSPGSDNFTKLLKS